MIDDLATAIKTKYESGSGAALRAVIEELYFTKATQIAASLYTTYAVFVWNGSGTDEYMGSDTTSKIEKAEIRFEIYNSSEDGGTILANAVYLLQNLFDWCNLSISGYTHVACERTGTAAVEYVDDIWSATVNYVVWFDG